MANNTEMHTIQPTTMNGRVFAPAIRLSFHTDQWLYNALGLCHNGRGEPEDPNYQVLSCTTQKTLDSPAGAFTITLMGDQWCSKLKAQDLVVIEMGYYAGSSSMDMETVMVGLIDRVERKRSIGSNGQPSVNTVVTGRDFGKLFVKDTLKFYPEVAGKNASDFFLTDTGWLQLMKVFTNDNIMKGTPAQLMWDIMKYIFPKIHSATYKIWDGSSQKVPKATLVDINKMIALQFGAIDFFMPLMVTADQYEGALWNLMQRASPPTFTELFIDTRPAAETWSNNPKNRIVPTEIAMGSLPSGFKFANDDPRVVLCLRPTPFDTAAKNNLVRHVIQQEDVIDEDLYVCDDQHYNLFWAGTSINPLGIDLKRVAPPLLNETNAKRFGLSPLEVSVDGMEISNQTTLEGMSRNYSGKLKAWFENNHLYWQGALDIRGNQSIRIGHMVNYGYSGFTNEFYVEGVNQNFTVFDGFTTQLTLSRGMAIPNLVDSSQYAWSPPKPTPPKAPAPTTKFYTVRKGDTLWSIARIEYGDALKWRKIWNANSAMLITRDSRNATDNGHWIYPAQKLIIPV